MSQDHESPSIQDLVALSGTVLDDRYELGHVLGVGGMGAVFAGTHIRLNKPVAVKILRAGPSTSNDFARRFLREAKAASTIHHPNVVEIFDFGEGPHGLVYLVMELLQGQDLLRVLREEPDQRLPWRTTCEVLAQAARGLRAAHERGIIHRDIKPANCFITKGADGELLVKVVDFGIAKIVDSELINGDDGLTGAGQILGTPAYMSPELAMDPGTAGPLSDVYALGVVAYRALTGRLPFSGATPFDVVLRSMSESPPPLRDHVSDLPPELEALVIQMLAKDPGARPPTMAAVHEALVGMLQLEAGRGHAPMEHETAAVPPPDEPRSSASSTLRMWAPSPPVGRSKKAAIAPATSLPAPWAHAASPQAAPTPEPPTPEPPTPSTNDELSYGSIAGDRIWTRRREGARREGGGWTGGISDAFAKGIKKLQGKSKPSRPEGLPAEVVPWSFIQYRESLECFLTTSFRILDVVAENVLRLAPSRSSTTTDDEATSYYAIFIEGGQGLLKPGIGESTFMAHVGPLEEHLARLPSHGGTNVVIAITEFLELGPGVRSAILEYRRMNIVLLPLHVGEVARAFKAGNVAALLGELVHEHHPVQDLFRGTTRVDPTRYFGRGSELSSLVAAIDGGSPLLGIIYGPPRSGRSSFLAMTQYCAGPSFEFVSIDCRIVRPRNPRQLSHVIKNAVAPELDDSDDHCALLSQALKALSRRLSGRLVVILEDCDWLVDLLDEGAKDDALLQDAHAFITTLADVVQANVVTVLLTSVHGYILCDRRVGRSRWLSSAAGVARTWRIGSLSFKECSRMMEELGLQMNIRFEPEALQGIYDASGGNVDAARMIGSTLLGMLRSRGHSEVSTATVDARMVEKAVDRITKDPSAFASDLADWYTANERVLLRFLAEKPRADADAQRLPDVTVELMARLRKGGVLQQEDDGRYSFCVPIFGRWIRRHVVAHKQDQLASRQRRRRRLMGVTVAAVCAAGVYYAEVMSRPETSLVLHEGCEYEVSHPKRVALDTPFDVEIGRSGCSQQERGTALVLVGERGESVATELACAAESCGAIAELVSRSRARSTARFTLLQGEAEVLTFVVDHDPLANVISLFREFLGATVAMVALIIAFFRDIQQLFSAIGLGASPKPKNESG